MKAINNTIFIFSESSDMYMCILLNRYGLVNVAYPSQQTISPIIADKSNKLTK